VLNIASHIVPASQLGFRTLACIVPLH